MDSSHKELEEKIAKLRQAIDKGDRGKLKKLASELDSSKSATDTARIQALAEILKRPEA